MQLQFRKCNLADVDKLAHLSRSTFIEAFQRYNDPGDFQSYLETAFSKEKIAEELREKDSIFYFVEDAAATVGYFKLNEYDAQNEFHDVGGMELERIYVVSDAQGKGIGARILKFIIEIATGKEKEYLWLGVWEHNHNAFRFYQRYGFEKFAVHPYYIGNDKQTDWLLKKQLHEN